MKIILLFILFSTHALGSDFLSFGEYKQNKSLLLADLQRIQKMDAEKHQQFYTDAIEQYKLFLQHFDHFNSKLSLKLIAQAANKNELPEVAEKILNLVNICEGVEKSYQSCLSRLRQLGAIPPEKKETKELLEDYIEEVSILEVFDKDFIARFNENVKVINQKLVPNNSASPLKPLPVLKPVVKKMIPPVDESYFSFLDAINWEYILLLGTGALIFLMSNVIKKFIILWTKKRIAPKDPIKNFYGNIFEVAKLNNREIKLFGHMDKVGLNIIKKIEKQFLQMLVYTNFLAPMAHVIFHKSKKILNIEIQFLSQHSIVELSEVNEEPDAIVLRNVIKELQQAVVDSGGEIIYVNNLNINGEITDSNLTISLPIR